MIGEQPNAPVRWARRTLDEKALETLRDAESRFPISLLAFSRESFECCNPDEQAAKVVQRPQPKDFARLPVVENDTIIGLFERRRRYSGQIVREVMVPLHEKLVMAAEASMLDFLELADQRPFVFLVERNGISGAVTLSDIQQIEARPAIFLRLTMFELLLTRWIRRCAAYEWENRLTNGQRKQIDHYFQQRSAAGEEIDKVAVASLTIKIAACESLGLFKDSDDADSATLKSFVQLRDQIAHSHDYAANETAAIKIPGLIRKLKGCINFLEHKLTGVATRGIRGAHTH